MHFASQMMRQARGEEAGNRQNQSWFSSTIIASAKIFFQIFYKMLWKNPNKLLANRYNHSFYLHKKFYCN